MALWRCRDKPGLTAAIKTVIVIFYRDGNFGVVPIAAKFNSAQTLFRILLRCPGPYDPNANACLSSYKFPMHSARSKLYRATVNRNGTEV